MSQRKLVKAQFSSVVPAEDVERHQPQPGELDDQHDDDEAAGYFGAHPHPTGADPELYRSHTGNGILLNSCASQNEAGLLEEAEAESFPEG